MRLAIILMTAGLALSGCASGMASGVPADSEYQKLKADCDARGGMLKPIPGANSPHDAANYVCEFRGTPPKKI